MVMTKISYCSINTDNADLKTTVKSNFEESSSRCSSRRIHSVIKSSGTTILKKVIRRIMKEEALVVPNIKHKKYNSCKVEINTKVSIRYNLRNRVSLYIGKRYDNLKD